MVYYDRILNIWRVDAFDYFLLSCFATSISASGIKWFFSQKRAIGRLKKSILAELGETEELCEPNFTSNKKVKPVYKLAMSNRGGDLVNLKFSSESFKLAQKVKTIVEQFVVLLKKKELESNVGILFKNGRLNLNLILSTYKIEIDYLYAVKKLSPQVIVLTTTVGSIAGFTLS